jgi:hypothetical protein
MDEEKIEAMPLASMETKLLARPTGMRKGSRV